MLLFNSIGGVAPVQQVNGPAREAERVETNYVFRIHPTKSS